MSALTERLGYGAADRLVIVSADRLGTCHAANVAVFEALRDGIATAAALMMPCPWARHAMYTYRGEDIGVGEAVAYDHQVDVARCGVAAFGQ